MEGVVWLEWSAVRGCRCLGQRYNVGGAGTGLDGGEHPSGVGGVPATVQVHDTMAPGWEREASHVRL